MGFDRARGGAGGFTLFLPEDDTTLVSESSFRARLAVGLGGRAAEELIFPDVTTGASGDLEHITRLARAMVTQFGMSKRLGPLTFGDKEELIFLGRQLSEQRNYSEEVAEEIDIEVRRLVDEAHTKALTILKENLGLLKLIADRLMEEETLDAKEFLALFETPASTTPPAEPTPGSSAQEGSTSSGEDSPPRMVPPSTAPLPA